MYNFILVIQLQQSVCWLFHRTLCPHNSPRSWRQPIVPTLIRLLWHPVTGMSREHGEGVYCVTVYQTWWWYSGMSSHVPVSATVIDCPCPMWGNSGTRCSLCAPFVTAPQDWTRTTFRTDYSLVRPTHHATIRPTHGTPALWQHYSRRNFTRIPNPSMLRPSGISCPNKPRRRGTLWGLIQV